MACTRLLAGDHAVLLEAVKLVLVTRDAEPDRHVAGGRGTALAREAVGGFALGAAAVGAGGATAAGHITDSMIAIDAAMRIA
jgi:hypothetical protein